MNYFLTKILVGSIAFLAILLLLLKGSSAIVESRGFTNSNTESNTLFIEDDMKYDILFMGISHARNFSRHENHSRIEKILDARIANIAQGKGKCGANEQLFYLKYFLSKGNQAPLIIYVLSPPLLFSETLPLATNTFDEETFSLEFLSHYLTFDSNNKEARLMSYISSKLHGEWLKKQPNTSTSKDVSLKSIDSLAIIEGQNLAYGGESMNFDQFEKTSNIIEQTVSFANEADIDMLLIIPPALFGQWRGHNEVLKFAEKLKNNYQNVGVADYSNSILEPQLYYDNHHLNTKGIVQFTETYLKPVIKQSDFR